MNEVTGDAHHLASHGLALAQGEPLWHLRAQMSGTRSDAEGMKVRLRPVTAFAQLRFVTLGAPEVDRVERIDAKARRVQVAEIAIEGGVRIGLGGGAGNGTEGHHNHRDSNCEQCADRAHRRSLMFAVIVHLTGC